MKKQKMQLLIGLLLLVTVIAGYFVMKTYNKAQNEKNENVAEGYQVTKDSEDEVLRFVLVNGEETYTFVKEGDTWKCNERPGENVNEDVLGTLLKSAISITGQEKIDNVQDMAAYGLENPQITVSYETKEGDRILKIGDYNAMVSQYYMCLNDEDTVYTVASYLYDIFDKTWSDLKAADVTENEGNP